MGIERLPTTLGKALDHLEDSETNTRMLLPTALLELYLTHKRYEDKLMSKLTEKAICDKYAAAY